MGLSSIIFLKSKWQMHVRLILWGKIVWDFAHVVEVAIWNIQYVIILSTVFRLCCKKNYTLLFVSPHTETSMFIQTYYNYIYLFQLIYPTFNPTKRHVVLLRNCCSARNTFVLSTGFMWNSNPQSTLLAMFQRSIYIFDVP